MSKYLDKYLEKKPKPSKEKSSKHKSSKPKKFMGAGLRIVDSDISSLPTGNLSKKSTARAGDDEDEDIFNDQLVDKDELPQIANFVDERPDNVRLLEEFRQADKWKTVAATATPGSGSDSDNSPPRQSKAKVKTSRSIRPREADSDESPPRPRRRDRDPDRSNKRKHSDSDVSPPRHGKHAKGNKSSHRRGSDSDPSPPRNRRNRTPDSDISPPRHSSSQRPSSHSRDGNKQTSRVSSNRKKHSDSDTSPPRHRQQQQQQQSRADRDRDPSSSNRNTGSNYQGQSSSRHRNRQASESPPPSHGKGNTSKQTKTLDGKKAGLQTAGALKGELEHIRRMEAEKFNQMDDEISGRYAKTKVRDRATGKERDFEAEMEKKREEDEKANKRKAQYDKWGKGLHQVKEQEERVSSAIHEMAKPLARYKDDEDLDEHLKNQDRDGDPMLAFLTKKKQKSSSGPAKPLYQGPPPPPNRFGIPPGYRWDGVDRSCGYEKEWFGRINARKALQDESYKWSVEDL